MAEDRRDLFGAGGPDAAPNPSHLQEKTAEELLNELEVELDDMSEADYDQARVDAYLDELDRREPQALETDLQAALARFHAARLDAGRPRPVRRLRAAAVLAAAVLGVMTIAQAAGLVSWGDWNARYFQLHWQSGAPQGLAAPALPDAPQKHYASLQSLLSDYGVEGNLAPTWLPEGFTLTREYLDHIWGGWFRFCYEKDGTPLEIALRYRENGQGQSGLYNKDKADVEDYVSHEQTHYLFSDGAQSVAVWANGGYECSIRGSISRDELKRMVDSVYRHASGVEAAGAQARPLVYAEYASAQDALAAYEIQTALAPAWLPDGYVSAESSVQYREGERCVFSFFYLTPETGSSLLLECSSGADNTLRPAEEAPLVQTVTRAGVVYTVIDEGDTLNTSWETGGYECVLRSTDDVAVETIFQVVDSIGASSSD